jgi:hypothetical protein
MQTKHVKGGIVVVAFVVALMLGVAAPGVAASRSISLADTATNVPTTATVVPAAHVSQIGAVKAFDSSSDSSGSSDTTDPPTPVGYVNVTITDVVTPTYSWPIQGVSVSLLDQNGTLVENGSTGPNGQIVLPVTQDGNYTVSFVIANDGVYGAGQIAVHIIGDPTVNVPIAVDPAPQMDDS